jgi:hypothetical protein
MKTPLERLLARVNIADSGCWEWTGPPNEQGYGQTFLNGRVILAHRAFYVLLVGPLGKGVPLDHLCHTRECGRSGKECPHRRCVNPKHLKITSDKENLARGLGNRLAERTHCAHGHEFTPENTRLTTYQGRSSRVCRECARLRGLKDPKPRTYLHPRSETHCRQGHERTPENTRHLARGTMDCKICANARRKRHRDKMNEETESL